MSSGSLFKFGVGYSYQDEDKRVIDSNALMADRLKNLSEMMQSSAMSEPSFGEDFAAGLDSVAVERLLEDGESESDGFSEGLFGTEEAALTEGSGNVIKAPRRPEAPVMPPIDFEAEKEKVLAEARAEADEIINAANNEADSIMENAKAMGYDQGYAQGTEAANAEYTEKFNQLKQLEDELNAKYDQLVDEIEPNMVAVISDVFEHVLHVKYWDDKEIIYHLIRDAIHNVDGNQNFIIHVSKDDFGYVSMQKKDLLSGISSADTAEIIEDLTLGKNECFIETGGGIFDCSLETQLSGLKRELKLLSYVKND